VRFLRTTEMFALQVAQRDLVGMVRRRRLRHRAGVPAVPLMKPSSAPRPGCGDLRRTFGPRDLTPGTTMDNVGGSMYWARGRTASSIPGVPTNTPQSTASSNAGSVFRYKRVDGRPLQVANKNVVRSSVGAGLTWPRRSAR